MEFNFATDESTRPADAVIGLFEQLSLKSGLPHKKIQRITKPIPFHLYTEDRGAEKKRKFVAKVQKLQYEEERDRIPKARLYPHTTDKPDKPPKPEVNHCTKPEPFQFECLKRHEEKVKWGLEVGEKMKEQEAGTRNFKAKPILRDCRDPLSVPPPKKKERKPLTDIQEFTLHVDFRAVERAKFDKLIKEKEMRYQRYREEMESSKMMEEERAVKKLRRTMVPYAQNMPNFDNPFHPQKSSKETTKATSPNLRVIQRKEKRRMMAATCALASHMR